MENEEKKEICKIDWVKNGDKVTEKAAIYDNDGVLKVVENKIAKDVEEKLNCTLSELNVKKIIVMEEGHVKVQYMLSKDEDKTTYTIDD